MYLFFIANDCNCFLPSLESGNRVKVIPQGQFILPSCFFLLRKTTEQNTSLSWTGIAAYAVEGCYVSCIITGYGGRPLSFLLIAEHFRTASIPLVLAWNWSIIWQTGPSKRCHPTLSALSFAYFNISFYFICICNCEQTPVSFPSFSCWPWQPSYAEMQHNIGALGSNVPPSHRGDVLLRKWPC